MANTRTGQGSTTSHVPGKRVMKEYPITEETLDNIGTLRTSASACFAIGSLALGFALSNVQSIALATGVSPVIVATWTAYGWASAIVAVAAYIADLLLERERRIEEDQTGDHSCRPVAPMSASMFS